MKCRSCGNTEVFTMASLEFRKAWVDEGGDIIDEKWVHTENLPADQDSIWCAADVVKEDGRTDICDSTDIDLEDGA